MNWTGGSLQRTKLANKCVVQKQKAYFAHARTHLQNGAKSPAAPFRPTHLQNDSSFELAGRLPSLWSGSVRHAGHSVRRRHGPIQHRHSPNNHTFQHGEGLLPIRDECRPKLSRGDAASTRPAEYDPREEQRKKRKADDTDPETRLLKVNRKRLLGQYDWIGVAPSRPVNLRFMSSKEKSKVGIRRKVEGNQGATARPRDDLEFMTQPFHPTGDQHAGAFVGATREYPNDIRIRIGTDALTTACSTQPNEHDQSHASSDLMLFDQQTHDTEQPVMHEPVQLDVQGVHPLEHLSTKSHGRITCGDNSIAVEKAQLDPGSAHLVTEGDYRDKVVAHRRSMRQALPEFADRSSPVGTPISEGSAQGLQLTQPSESVGQPLHLTFPESISSGGPCSRTAVHDNGHGWTDQAFEASHAGKSQRSCMHHLGNKSEPQSESEAAPAVSIVDEKSWKSFLDIPENSSSHTTAVNDSRKSIVHHHSSAVQTREAERASWSQHATQGDHPSSSLISASLPSLKRDAQTLPSTHEPRTRLNRPGQNASAKMNEDEQIWQNFVLGSNGELSSETMHECQDDSEQRMWKGSSGYLPLSVAVSSIGSPFRPISGRAPRMHHDVHDAARFAQPGSRSITSPAAVPAGFVEEPGDHDQDDFVVERCTLGESVTQANGFGNVSPLSSRMFSHTETSRSSLEHPGHSGSSLFEHAQANRGEIGWECERSSVYGIPDTEDEGLDLIDVD